MKPKYVKLSKPYSQAIMKDQCPFCEHYMECNNYIMENDKYTYMLCKLRSNEHRYVWIEISPYRRRRVNAGDRYGKLVVVDINGYDPRGYVLWLCRCDCGNETIVRGDHLLDGSTKSCGCIRRNGGISTVLYGDNTKKETSSRYMRGSSRNPDGSKHKYPHEYTSRVGCAVDIPVKLYDKEDPYDPEKNGLKYVRLHCDECGGVVRYNKHDLMECERCGLIYEWSLSHHSRS